MSDPARAHSGVRLPLLLLLGFLAAIAGVVVWLTVMPAEPTPPAPVDRTGSVVVPLTPEAHSPAPSTAAPAQATPPPATAEVPPRPASPDAQPETAPSPPPDEPQAASQTEREETPAAVPLAPPAARDGTASAPTQVEKRPPPPVPPVANNGLQIARLPPINRDAPLKPAPDPDLVEETSIGRLPQRASDGRVAWLAYAKPFDRTDKRPRVAIVVNGLGLSAAATESAIQGLPGSVSLAFAPYAPELDTWIRLARAAGHEALLNVPMEPVNYPAYDPGPQTLLTSLNAQGNIDRLLWILSRGAGYVGVVDFMGSRFTASQPHMEPVLAALKERGLLYLDSGSATRSATAPVAERVDLPWATASLTLDERASRVEIDKKFAELERLARSSGRAIGIASPYPVSLERIATWSRQLAARGIAVAPVSAMVRPGGQAARN